MIKEYEYFKKQLLLLDIDQKLLLLVVATIFMPVWICVVTIFLFVCYLCKTGKITQIFEINKAKFLFMAAIISFFTSFFYGNIVGMIWVVGIIFAIIVGLYYRIKVDKNLFFLVIKVVTFMSFIAAIIGLYQFFNIVEKNHFEHILAIGDKPEQRVFSVFGNANYYATIIEFVILMSIYKLTIVKDRYSSTAYYIFVILVNVFMLYLTGCRTAWVAIFSAIPFMFLFKRKLKLGLILIMIEIIFLMTMLFSGHFPRIDTVGKDFVVRIDIWKNAGEMFFSHPLFGMGPRTYGFVFRDFGGPHTVHAHSIYFDPLINFGIVTLSIAGIYFMDYIKLFLISSHKKSYSFIGGILVATAIHGLFDTTIFYLQTGLLFFLIINSIGLRELPKEIKRNTDITL